MNTMRQKGSTDYPVPIFMVLSSDHVTPATGKDVSLSISKNGGAPAPALGAVSEIGGGWYAWAGNVDDRDSLGTLVFVATASGCDASPGAVDVVEGLPFEDVVAAVWGFGRRLLTVLPSPPPDEEGPTAVSILRGDEWVVQLTGLGSLVGRTALWVTVKNSVDQVDDDATVQITETDGLVRLNGVDPADLTPPLSPTDGAVVVDDAAAGDITITLKGAASKEVAPQPLVFDVQILDAGGQPQTKTLGDWTVLGDVTRAVE